MAYAIVLFTESLLSVYTLVSKMFDQLGDYGTV
jgi:hypothetical protein